MPSLSALTVKPAPARESVYRRLLVDENREWSVSTLVAALAPPNLHSADTVRTILYVLLADGVVDTVSGHRAVTFRLAAGGGPALRAVLHRWKIQNS